MARKTQSKRLAFGKANPEHRAMITKSKLLLPRPLLILLLATGASMTTLHPAEAAPNLVIWDTVRPLGSTIDLNERTAWKAVPSNLFALEANPPKASSDPGYYGREYEFKGDAIVENHALIAVFASAQGQVVIYSKATPLSSPTGAGDATALPSRITGLVPLQSGDQHPTIKSCQVVRNANDEVVLAVSFVTGGSDDSKAIFSLGKDGIVEVKPSAGLKGFRLQGPLDYGIVPSFIGDDLIFSPADQSSSNRLWVPCENLFLGLVPGEANVLVMTWPKGQQQMQLGLSKESQGKRSIESIEFDAAGQSFYLAALAAPGIWHKEPITPDFLEKDVPSKWTPPFPASWKTQLLEEQLPTTYVFRQSKGEIWRGVPGSYTYPVWFSNGRPVYHLGKKVSQQGDSLVYFLEGDNTPAWIQTPVDILKATLGRSMSDLLLDPAGRALRTHHRRGSVGVRRACTCGCTEAIQAVFETGEEVQKQEYIDGALEDMIYFVQRHVARIAEYQHFAQEMVKFLQTNANSAPDLKPFLENLEQIAQQIPDECANQKENMKSLAYAAELTQKTKALAEKKDSKNLAAYMELLKDWRAMGGAQDYVVAKCHIVARKLMQQAGYTCVNQTQAAKLAEVIRARCKQVLRNPDGYEIWPNY